jgi:ATP-dependent helicase/DNAse subunit B
VIPRPAAHAAQPDVLAVTAFQHYLASPYRFYLRHVEGLRDVDDTVEELTAASFGNLAHAVLGRFGASPLKDSHDPQAIAAYLSTELDAVAREAYGDSPMMAVEIQLEQARARLQAFAAWQAGWARQGWRIERSEATLGEIVATLDLGEGQSVRVRGRIDRIDRHADGRWLILDYKTGERTDTPEKSHRKDGEWINLQLPLYRHLARQVGVTGNVQVGYIRLPRDTNDIGEELAAWTEADLEDADETAREVARRILAGRFWVELESGPSILGEYGPICQDGVFKREVVV